MSDYQQEKGRMGRPSKRTEAYKRTSIELPVTLLTFLETAKPSRTEWLVEAIREKQERDRQFSHRLKTDHQTS